MSTRSQPAESMARDVRQLFALVGIPKRPEHGGIGGTSRRGQPTSGRPPEGVVTGSTVLDLAEPGWRAMEVLITEPGSSDDGDVGTTATVVAACGALLAEVSWHWSIEQGARLDPHWGPGQAGDEVRTRRDPPLILRPGPARVRMLFAEGSPPEGFSLPGRPSMR
ncbi:hypothetical protein [Nonomuraea sp. NPDC049607]|uniref:hypothetical protein n=1 Tax=Nonomuraea sp. NPDC049607 TaxID=3154732 RepID=UPI00342355FD